MEDIKIESGVAMPKFRHSTARKYPFKDMNVGDSFFIPADNKKDMLRMSGSVSACWAAFKKNHKKDWVFRTNKVDGGIRVWRIA